MRPSNPIYKSGGVSLTDLKLSRQSAVSDSSFGVYLSDLPNMLWTHRSSPPWITSAIVALFNGVVKIFLLCANPKMVWIYAGRIVSDRTVVMNLFAFGDRSIVNNPRCATGDYNSRSSPSTPYLAMAERPSTARPNPACVRFMNMFPESFNKGWSKVLRKRFLDCKVIWHIKSLFFGLLARRQLQLPRAPSIFYQSPMLVNSF